MAITLWQSFDVNAERRLRPATLLTMLVLIYSLMICPAGGQAPEENKLSKQAGEAEKEARNSEALRLAAQALKKDKSEENLRRHARLSEVNHDHKGAASSYTELMELKPGEARLWHQRGVAKFMLGDFKGAVEDFDIFLEKEPEQMPAHWQRGLAQYGAGLYAAGRAQFEAHQEVNPNDVENAAWHFLCVARLEGVEAARKALIPIRGDGRVPMAQIHDLFAGKGSEDAVLEAAKREQANRRNHLCYAHLYLALYKEALGHAEEALKHYQLAAEDYRMEHYMGETARVFFQSRKRKLDAAP